MKVWLLVVVVAALVWTDLTDATDCSFPQYLKQRPRWEGKITFARRKTSTYWKFYEDTVEMIDYSKPRPERYEQKCEEQLPGQKYILREVEGKLEKYVCIQFVQRSDHVVQMKSSDRSPDMSVELCEDGNLRVDDWPLVWPKADEKYQSCPISGGFDFSITNHAKGTTMCDDAFLMPHMESECMSGEGINLDFRHFECRGDLDMELVNDFVCLGSWESEGYSFSVVTDRDEFWPKLWMFRFPIIQGASFDVKLMGDIVADSRDTVRATKTYYTLHMKRTIYPSLCSDESTWCEGDCGKADTYFCQKTCSRCDDTQSVPKCSFPTEAKGEWMEISQQTNRGVTVTTSMMYAEDFLPLQCYDLNTQAWFEGEGKRAVATLFKNGCRPRYTCVQFQRLSDSVIHYRLSQNLIWPFSLSVTAQQICDTKNFQDDPPPLHSRIRSEHPKALIKRVGMNGRRELMDCGLRKLLHLRAQLRDSELSCNSEINTCYSNTSFTVNMGPGCSWGHESEISSYGCLASWTAGTDHFIISENKADSNDLKCWVFHRDAWNLRPTSKVYLMHPADCHTEAAANIEYKNGTNYLMQFDIVDTKEGLDESCPSEDASPVHHTTPVRLRTTEREKQTTKKITDSGMHVTTRVPGLEKTSRPTFLQPEENAVGLDLSQAREQKSSAGDRPNVGGGIISMSITCILYISVLL